jgi:phosphoserine phosphatase
MTKVIYVARHGETDWNRDGRYQGRRESALTALGIMQARRLDVALAGAAIDRVISSPLRRCVETARPVALRRGVEVEADPDLLEIGHGVWEGRLRSDIEREEPQLIRAWRERPDTVLFPGGESLADVDRRWRVFADRLGRSDRVLVVTHDVIVRVAILSATNRSPARLWEPRVVNGGFAVFAGGGGWELVHGCIEHHLAGALVDPASQAL